MECNLPFFGETNLKGFTYYYYLPHLSFLSRKELSDKITHFEGKITFTLSSQTILIIQELKDMQSKEFMGEIRAFGDISFYHNKNTINIQHNRPFNNDMLRCILLSDLLEVISEFESRARQFSTLVAHGVPQSANKEAMIALLLPRDVEKKAHYHQFQLGSNKEMGEYDIPRFIPSVPFNFGVFCTYEEKLVVDDYMNQCSLNKVNSIENGAGCLRSHKVRKDEFQTPQPYKEHTFCHLCKQKYKEYFSHVQSAYHRDMVEKNKSVFNRINNTIDRIKSHNKKEEELRKKDELRIKEEELRIKEEELRIKEEELRIKKEELKREVELRIKEEEQRIKEEEQRIKEEEMLTPVPQPLIISIPLPVNFRFLLGLDKPPNNLNIASAVTIPLNPPHCFPSQSLPQFKSSEKTTKAFPHLIQETSQTQFNTNISGDTHLIKTMKNEESNIFKRKYDQIREGNYATLGENKHYLRITAQPKIMTKLNTNFQKP